MNKLTAATALLVVMGYFTGDALGIAYGYIGSKRYAAIAKTIAHVCALVVMVWAIAVIVAES